MAEPAHWATLGPEGSRGAGGGRPVPWWSFTKTLLAAAVLRLAEQGRVLLDAPLEGRPFTPRDLLRHRAGVGDYGAVPAYHAAVARGDAPWTAAEFLERVPPDRLICAPGRGFAYSNIGYLLLRQLVERCHGAGLGAALRALVLDPLELPAAHVADTVAGMAATPFPGGHGYHPGWVAHGLVVGPPAEAAQALHRLLNGSLLSAASRAAMLRACPVGGPLPGRPWTDTGYGLGLMIGAMPGLTRVAGHSAGGPGSTGAVYHAPATGRTAAAFLPEPQEGAAEWAVARLLAA